MKSLYNSRVEIDFNEKIHRYKANGVFVPGVTTVIDVLKKDLMGWAAWMAAEAFKEAVSEFATTDRRMTKAALKKLANDAKKAHEKRSQTGMDVGTIAHKWIEEETNLGAEVMLPTYAGGLRMSAQSEAEIKIIDENVEAATHCIEQWRRWKKDYGIEIIKSEFLVYSEKLKYCGTVDVLFRSRRTGKLYLGDYKTSEPEKVRDSKYRVVAVKAYPEHLAQIAGYDYAHYEEHGIEVDEYAVIYLPKPKEGKPQPYNMITREVDRSEWENLFRTYQWINKLRSKNV